LPANESFEDILDSGLLDATNENIYDEDFLVFDLDTLGDRNFFADVVRPIRVGGRTRATGDQFSGLPHRISRVA
jgi:hypothetical protein